MIEFLQLLGGWVWLLALIILIMAIALFYNLKKHNKQMDITEISAGPVKLAITDIPVRHIAFLSQPRDISGRPAVLPDIKIRVYSESNHPLDGRKVAIEIMPPSRVEYLHGILERITDINGDVIFSDLRISRSGQYEFKVKSEGQFAISASFEVTPPGLDTDFSAKAFGSTEYKDALAQKLMLCKAEDDIYIDEEKI